MKIANICNQILPNMVVPAPIKLRDCPNLSNGYFREKSQIYYYGSNWRHIPSPTNDINPYFLIQTDLGPDTLQCNESISTYHNNYQLHPSCFDEIRKLTIANKKFPFKPTFILAILEKNIQESNNQDLINLCNNYSESNHEKVLDIIKNTTPLFLNIIIIDTNYSTYLSSNPSIDVKDYENSNIV